MGLQRLSGSMEWVTGDEAEGSRILIYSNKFKQIDIHTAL